MAKEQEEAIDYVQKQIDYFKEQIKFIEAVDSDYYDEEYGIYKNRVKQFEAVLNMLKEKEEEIEKKDKIIDLMAEVIYKKINRNGLKKYCNKDKSNCESYKECFECIKQYFERKCEE